MPDRPIANLRVEPHMIPALTAAYDRAALDVTTLLDDISRRGRIPEPYTPDVISVAMAEHYNDTIMDSPHSAYAALRHYERELLNIRDTLRRMASTYDSTEDINTRLWRAQ